MEKVANEIDARLKLLKERMNQQNSHLAEIEAGMKRLKSEKQVTINNINTLSGAIQAYEESNKLLPTDGESA